MKDSNDDEFVVGLDSNDVRKLIDGYTVHVKLTEAGASHNIQIMIGKNSEDIHSMIEARTIDEGRTEH